MTRDRIINYYSGFDEWGRLEREPLEFIINMHYIRAHLPAAGLVLDNGAGPGKYAMELAKLGYHVTLSDLTPASVDIAREKAQESNLMSQFEGFHVLDATRMEGIPDETYDASLMLGPLYHLQAEQERVAAMKELHRVTKPDGVVFIAMQSRMRMGITSLQSPQQWKPNDHMSAIRSFVEKGTFDHQDQGRFTGAYYFNIPDIKPFMEEQGFETINLIGSSSLGAMLTEEQQQYWKERGEYDELIQFMIEMAQDPSILGISSHLLYIGKKK
ncbi:class I SAM-dependent methyltransferase [Paenibacillus xylanilyticus]|uniref:Class I SAM-dependent methyltransferase n=1 Tax=Paenibacillus xylanilyticus TaxID=248903 RepID=A0A7Y6EUP1_9BACL|nr:class I SAM-dependent methyltransferase [Paenibacillus xylanilyticus]NUU77317.1 class I SAM-dependent methyltransferase [Paenibacillus xylanilyticus]